MSLPTEETETSPEHLLRLTLDNQHTIIEHYTFPGGSMVVNTEAIAQRYFKTTKRDSGLLPPVVRWISPDFKTFLIERPPFEASVQFKPTLRVAGGDQRTYTFHVPWTVYAVNFHDADMAQLDRMWVWVRNSSIFSEDDHLYRAPYPNVFAEGRVCSGGLLEEAISMLDPEEIDTASILNCLINIFWSSPFNMDVVDYAVESTIPEFYVEKGVLQLDKNGNKDYFQTGRLLLEEMEKVSQMDALEMAYKEASWAFMMQKPSGVTVGDVIQHFSAIQEEGEVRPFLSLVRELTRDV